jgi:very-short-patch-repair endonuclease
MASEAERQDPPELERARQLFQFLKAFSERRVPTKRTMGDQPWSLWLRMLPSHPSVQVTAPDSPVSIEDKASAPASDGVASADAPLIKVTRPKITNAPEPPAPIREFVVDGWADPHGSVSVRASRNVVVDGNTEIERFDADPVRPAAFDRWRQQWGVWAENERPARAAMATFERLYDLRARMEREGEGLELVLGDGRLRWRPQLGQIDHPVLLQRVELTFDPSGPEFEVNDAERPPELYSPLLQEAEALTSERLQQLRKDLASGAYHPLSGEAADGFFTRLAPLLGRQGSFSKDRNAGSNPGDPLITRDPVLFLRARQSGFAEAFDKVLQDLDARRQVPPSLTRLVGVETELVEVPSSEDTASPWGEPEEVLLSKPANAEQVRIARALEQHRAVLVQGPPGTGKSHTIANLIGHLVAQGKRVLVTSHTTKALRVLRSQIVEPLQPLCVSVLDQDLESRAQLEQAVRGILMRLTNSSASQLDHEVQAQTNLRRQLNERIRAITADLRTVREGEYTPIVVAGSSEPPADAARWVRENVAGNTWIPGPLEAGVPCPLSPNDVARLYATNDQLTDSDEETIRAQFPNPDQLPTPFEFREWVTTLQATENQEFAQYWERSPNTADREVVSTLLRVAQDLATELAGLTKGQLAVVAGGAASQVEKAQWTSLAKQVADTYREWQRARPLLLEHPVEAVASMPETDVAAVCEAIAAHVEAGGTLGWMQTGVLHREWKPLIEESRVDGRTPRTAAEFRALAAKCRLEVARDALRGRWKRQAVAVGWPAVPEGDFEPALMEQVSRFQDLLAWWELRRTALEQAMTAAGFKWLRFRDWHAARGAAVVAFERDCALVRGPLLEVVQARLQAVARAGVLEAVARLETVLRPYAGDMVGGLMAAVRALDPARYETGHGAFSEVHEKRTLWQQRVELLGRIDAVAPSWANAIAKRVGEHGRPTPPGEALTAWKWRQLTEEIDRRARLDEEALTRQLHQRREELRAATASLIDAKAWRAQLARTGLAARAALQGWVDTVRKIGKGHGRRAPELQVRARQLLTDASAAVPVWIMPLGRVAESIDPMRNRFNVVIVDEASQSDVTGLLAWYLGDQVAVVGDHEQVSPSAVGQEVDVAKGLIEHHLDGIPNRHLYDGKTSVYDLARQCFGGAIALREHFRSVPEIIGFSDELSYNFEIRPLRNPSSAPRPHVAEFVVDSTLGSLREGKSNAAEARAAAALLKAMTEDGRYGRSSMGAITLLGDEQAHLIHETARALIDPIELERRRFAVGNPAQFQGDERDVMLLSMVDVPAADGTLRLSETDGLKQRYNVAASRARDQLWLVHSLDPGRDLKPGDLRRRLIEYVRDPLARHRELAKGTGRAESPFEVAVIECLISAGYAVQPQVSVGNYRIDIVVSDGARQMAIECDGDRYHPAERLGEDMARQAVLERAGWRFIRVRGSRFYRDPDGTMERVFRDLEASGVAKTSIDGRARPDDSEVVMFKEQIVRRAWEILRERGWVVTPPAADAISEASIN